jgi:poly(A) polymerase
MLERDFAIDVVRRLQGAGFQALWAGGCVRDELLGLTPKDYDVATDATPEQVQKLFRRTVAVGASFGVIEVLGPRQEGDFLTVEVATFRSDVSYSDGRHPDAVVFSSAREDALRRDFTVNGMFFDPVKGQLLDYVGGQADLNARILRAIGEPRQRFGEDKLRLLRAVRIAARFDLAIEPATAAAIRELAGDLPVVSAERIANELRRLLVHRRRSHALNLLFDLRLLQAILPELVPMKVLPQGLPAAPSGYLWDHVMAVLDFLGEEPSFPLALAALLHDVGKPRVVGRTPDRYTFYHHEHVGARLADEICERLKLSNDERARTVWLVEKHQFLSEARQMRTSKLKTMLNHPGIRELLALHRADALASGRGIDHVEYCEFLLQDWTQEDLNPAPLLNGHDLMRHFGLVPGPLYKELLTAVREAQLDGTIKTKPQALELVERLLREQKGGG